MILGLVEFLLISGLVLAVAIFELVPLWREKRRRERAARDGGKPPT